MDTVESTHPDLNLVRSFLSLTPASHAAPGLSLPVKPRGHTCQLTPPGHDRHISLAP